LAISDLPEISETTKFNDLKNNYLGRDFLVNKDYMEDYSLGSLTILI